MSTAATKPAARKRQRTRSESSEPAEPEAATDEAKLAPSTREELEALREGKVARGPSGFVYRIRRLNLERHALAGGLPSALVAIAMGGRDAINETLQELKTTPDSPQEQQRHREMQEYLDRLVVTSIVEPTITVEDLGDPKDMTSTSLIPPDDYHWLVNIAFREEDYDADGNRLWGVESMSRFPGLSDLVGMLESGQG